MYRNLLLAVVALEVVCPALADGTATFRLASSMTDNTVAPATTTVNCFDIDPFVETLTGK